MMPRAGESAVCRAAENNAHRQCWYTTDLEDSKVIIPFADQYR